MSIDNYIADRGDGHPCYCIGPQPGHAMCPCTERACGLTPIMEETEWTPATIPGVMETLEGMRPIELDFEDFEEFTDEDYGLPEPDIELDFDIDPYDDPYETQDSEMSRALDSADLLDLSAAVRQVADVIERMAIFR